MDKHAQSIERKLSFRFLSVKFDFEVIIIVRFQGRPFGCNRSLWRRQLKKKCCWQEEGSTQRKSLPSDGAFKKAKASCVPRPQNLPRFAIGPGFGPPPQSSLS